MLHLNTMRQWLYILAIVQLFLIPPAFAYTGSNDRFGRGYKPFQQAVTGRILGPDGRPLSGVSVTVR